MSYVAISAHLSLLHLLFAALHLHILRLATGGRPSDWECPVPLLFCGRRILDLAPAGPSKSEGWIAGGSWGCCRRQRER